MPAPSASSKEYPPAGLGGLAGPPTGLGGLAGCPRGFRVDIPIFLSPEQKVPADPAQPRVAGLQLCPLCHHRHARLGHPIVSLVMQSRGLTEKPEASIHRCQGRNFISIELSGRPWHSACRNRPLRAPWFRSALKHFAFGLKHPFSLPATCD